MLKIAWSPIYKYRLPDGHRFPMDKYELIREQLLYDGTVTEASFFCPKMLAEADALLTHTKDYFDKLNECRLSAKEERAIGFPINEKFIERARVISNGTIECATFARENGVALNSAGGTHHAFADRGEGYCCFNDQAVAANYLLHNGLAQKILIVDLDVHQGNGTHAVFAGNDRVYTFSMHGRRNYPFHKVPGDLDVELEDGTGDDAYLELLADALPRVLLASRAQVAFYLAGADAHGQDRLGRLAMTHEGLARRDHMVLRACREVGTPVVITIAGGYGHDIATTVEAHVRTVRAALEYA